jgi:PAS domain S-box-containing protein
MSVAETSVEQLLRENEELRRRLEEAEDTIRAISGGEVDAFVVQRDQAEVLTLGTADRPYRLLVETMGQGAATAGADATVLYANRRFAELLDVPLKKLIGSRLAEYVPATEEARFDALLREGRAGAAEVELTLRRGDGGLVHVGLTANALPEGAGGVCFVITDLTERQRRERERVQLAREQAARVELERQVEERTAELRQAQEKALQAERLAAIGQMAAGLAHESRNALQRNQACLSVLALRLQARPEELALLTRMQRAQDDLHRLYEDVREYAGPVVLDRRTCRLAALCREAWHSLAPHLADQPSALHMMPPGVDWECSADPFLTKQVFRNLLENALAAGADRVEVSFAADRGHGRDVIRVVVRDNGPGFTPEQREKLFEPFHTTKVRGTGLGLAICKRVVEAHGGRIEAGDNHGPGAEVIIVLPRREA